LIPGALPSWCRHKGLHPCSGLEHSAPDSVESGGSEALIAQASCRSISAYGFPSRHQDVTPSFDALLWRSPCGDTELHRYAHAKRRSTYVEHVARTQRSSHFGSTWPKPGVSRPSQIALSGARLAVSSSDEQRSLRRSSRPSGRVCVNQDCASHVRPFGLLHVFEPYGPTWTNQVSSRTAPALSGRALHVATSRRTNVSEPRGLPPLRPASRLARDVETTHPDLSEWRSTLLCLSTVHRIESLWLDLSRQCSTPRLLSKARCRAARTTLVVLRSASVASRRSTPGVTPELNQVGAPTRTPLGAWCSSGSRIDGSISPDSPCSSLEALGVESPAPALARAAYSASVAFRTVDASSRRLNSIRSALSPEPPLGVWCSSGSRIDESISPDSPCVLSKLGV
jgi:hypothetical protein